MIVVVEPVKAIVVNQQSDDFAGETDPLSGPSKNKGMDQEGRGRRIEQRNGEPDAHTGHSTAHHGEQHEEPDMTPCVALQGFGTQTARFNFGQHQQQAAAHGKVSDVNMDDGDERNEQTATCPIQFPDRIVHCTFAPCHNLIMYPTAAMPKTTKRANITIGVYWILTVNFSTAK